MAREAVYGRLAWDVIREERRAARHKRMLELMAEGLTDAEIADEMHYALGTLKPYVKELYVELGARSRAHAVAIALREGMIQ